MAKSSKKKDKKDGAQSEAVDAIRAAIERGLQVSAEGAQATRERTRELVDEIASAAGRVRQSLEDMRVLDELRKLRTEVEALATRVAALERPRASKPATTGTSTSSRPAATKSTASRVRRKPATRKPAAKKSASSRSRAKKTTGTSTAAKKSTGTSTAAKKPTGSS
jgi:hypothetical protein